MIAENIAIVKEKIAEACKKSGRDASSVTLISVSKTKPVPMLEEAYAAGSRDFGENKVQEMCDKMEVLPADIRWHMIGHLQTNKVKYISGKTYLIHSVDTYHLAQVIEKEAVKNGCISDVLIEINAAGEDSKFGTSDMAANTELIKQVSALEHVRVKGLMTIAPMTDDPESNRKYFAALREFSLKPEFKDCFDGTPLLSMGMTGDYTVAVEEGADFVRVGTGIFGERDYGVHV